MQHERLAVSIAEAVKISGIGRSSLYIAIATGLLKTKKFGRRRIVEMSALREFLDQLPGSSGKGAR